MGSLGFRAWGFGFIGFRIRRGDVVEGLGLGVLGLPGLRVARMRVQCVGSIGFRV